MSAGLQRAWAKRGALAWGLWPVSLAFGALAAARRALFRLHVLRSTRMRVPVVVVGNRIVGGAGKTPVVIAVVEHLRSRGLHVGVISRGYGRRGDEILEVLEGTAASEAGDEPLLVKRRTGVPVFVGAHRAAAAGALLRAYPQTQVIVSDDGLQHYALQRDIEVCVVDERGEGNGFLLPAGPLREAASRRVDITLGGERGLRLHRQLAPYVERADGRRIALAELRLQGKPLKALAGIAKPEAFFSMLRAQGVEVAEEEALPDHHDFARIRPADEQRFTLVCTEKDAVKLWRQRPDAWAVPLTVEIESKFFEEIDRLLDAKLSSRDGPEAS